MKGSKLGAVVVSELRLDGNCSKPSLVFLRVSEASHFCLALAPSPRAVSISRETYKHDPAHNGLKGSIDGQQPEGGKSTLKTVQALESAGEETDEVPYCFCYSLVI